MKNKIILEKGGMGGIIGAVLGVVLVVATGGVGAIALGVGAAAGYGIGSLFDSNGQPTSDGTQTTCDPAKQDCSGGSTQGQDAAAAADPTNNPEYCLAVVQHLSAVTNATTGLDEEMKKTKKELEIAKLALARATGASSATSTNDTTTTVSTSTLANLAPLAISVSPNKLHLGDSATFYLTINNSISTYSLDLYKDGKLAGTLAGNQTVLGSARPVILKFPFSVTTGTPLGDFKIRVLDANSPSTYAEADFSVVDSSVPLTNQYGTASTGNSNTSAASATISSVKFLNPYAYGIVPRNKTTNISWSYTGPADAKMNIYANVKCVKKVKVCKTYNIDNPTKACTTVKSTCTTGPTVKIPIATNVKIANQSMKWKVPSKIVGKQAVIYAEQNGKKIGTGQSFYVSY
jgi:hypothetical protein